VEEVVVICGGDRGGGDHSSMVRLSLIKPRLLTPHVWFFFFFPYFGTLESNKQQSKEGNNQSMGGGDEICWMYPFAINQIKQSFVNKVVKFLSTKSEEIVDFVCCVVYAPPFGNTPLELLILLRPPRFKRKLVFGMQIWKGTLFKT